MSIQVFQQTGAAAPASGNLPLTEVTPADKR
jgi:hypothetical protein